MAKPELPWFKFFATDWISDPTVTVMSSRQVGWYVRLLAFCWQEGGLPSDRSTLRILSQVPRDENMIAEAVGGGPDEKYFTDAIEKEFEIVVAQFCLDLPDGRISHPKLHKQYIEILEVKEKQRAGGVAGANKRYGSSNYGQSGIPTESAISTPNGLPITELVSKLLVRASGISSLKSKESNTKKCADFKNIRFPDFGLDATFAPFVEEYVKTERPLIQEDFIAAHWLWRKMDFEQRELAITSLIARREAGLFRDPSRVHLPANYLQGEYKRALPGPKKSANGDYRDTYTQG